MSKTKYVYFTGELLYPKLTEANRDMGTNLLEGSDQYNKFKEVQGFYTVDVLITKEEKKKMIADGIPNKGMAGQLFKENDDGDLIYRVRRQHFNPAFVNEEKGQDGIMGPPKILIKEDGKNRKYDQDNDGLIGNGTAATVKVNVWDNKKVTLEAVQITDLIVYESENDNDF